MAIEPATREWLFHVDNRVIEKIDQLRINNNEKKALIRCVGGYSCPSGFIDRVNKLRYRIYQYGQSYPDWKLSSNRLEISHANEIVGIIRLLPSVALDCILRSSGEAKLKELIEKNNTRLNALQ